jgi:hypothetical protein
MSEWMAGGMSRRKNKLIGTECLDGLMDGE